MGSVANRVWRYRVVMAVRVHLIGGHFDGRFHDMDVDPHLMPMDLSMNYEDEDGAVRTQLYRASPAQEPGGILVFRFKPEV